MRICDNCMTPAEHFEHIRSVEFSEASKPTPEYLADLAEDDPGPDVAVTVTCKTELCESCRNLLNAQDWSGLAAAKRISTVKRVRKSLTPIADAFQPGGS